MADKYSYEEFESLLKGREPILIQKAFLLANGMISAYGYDKESALAEAVTIAQDWYDQNKEHFE